MVMLQRCCGRRELRAGDSLIGMRRRILKKPVRDVGREAAYCSSWIYLLGLSHFFSISRKVELSKRFTAYNAS